MYQGRWAFPTVRLGYPKLITGYNQLVEMYFNLCPIMSPCIYNIQTIHLSTCIYVNIEYDHSMYCYTLSRYLTWAVSHIRSHKEKKSDSLENCHCYIHDHLFYMLRREPLLTFCCYFGMSNPNFKFPVL